MEINKNIRASKTSILNYFRDRATEFLAEVNNDYGNTEYKKKAKRLNVLLVRARVTLIEIIEQKAKKEKWSNEELLEGVLMVTYCNYVVMLEARHSVWPYEYMVDFKSGFGSNEKGNTNRLLLVASIYHNLEEDYKPLIFAQSEENNLSQYLTW